MCSSDLPVGFKNGTDGSIKVAVDALRAAAAPHAFMGMTKTGQAAIFETVGNEDCHVILRGGRGKPNYDRASIADALSELRAAGLPERLLVDASHDNSGKDHKHQPVVAREIADQIASPNPAIVGVMLESFLVPGRQDLEPGRTPTYGQSVTDACMGWDTTASVLDRLAGAVRARRGRP